VRPAALLVTGLSTILLVAGCSTEQADPGPKFKDDGRKIACMAHQPAKPGARYTDADLRRTDETLPVLRYYTTNAEKPYCDGKPPTEIDKAWGTLYVNLGADRKNVETLLK
jgi:hypothetical protein